MLTYIVFVFFLLIILYGVNHEQWMAGLFIVIVYALSAFFSILLLKVDSTFHDPAAFPTIVYCSLLFFTFKPFLRKAPTIDGFCSTHERRRFINIGYALSISVVLGMVLILPRIGNVMDYGLVETRTDMYHGELEDNSNDSFLVRIGFLLVGYFGGIWYLYLTMFFFALVFLPGKHLLKTLLILASLSQVEVGLTVGGRTNAIYWLLSFLFTLLLFHSYLNRKTKKIAISASVVFLSIVLGYVAYITIARSGYHEGGTQGFLFEYIGESYLYFCEFFDRIEWHPYTLERVFPFISHVIGTGFNLGGYRALIEQHTGMDIGIFYTFMGDIFVDIGLLGLLLFIFVYYRVSNYIMRPHVFHFKDLCYLSIVYVVPLHGLFYYSLWRSGDFCVLFILLIAMYVTRGVKLR